MTYAPGGTDSLVIPGQSSGSIVVPPNGFYQLIYDAAVATWYVITGSQERVQRRLLSITSSATPAIDTDNYDSCVITALAANITGFTMTGTPQQDDTIVVTITDNGTARTLAFGTSWIASTQALPTTTVASTPIQILGKYNTALAKWVCVAVA